MEVDWQINCKKIKDRARYLLLSEKWTDCRFSVCTSSNQFIFAAHKLFLAMASPVFECMFYGSLQEKNDPIIIPDIQPEAFGAMLDYIYTDEISKISFDNACYLYYAAKKYMLPHLVDRCTTYFLNKLSPINACRVLELSKLYDDQDLMKCSKKVIMSKTMEVITDPSFMDIEISTLMSILDLNSLNINSELDLFNCLLKFAKKYGLLNGEDEVNPTDAGPENAADDASDSGNSSEAAANMITAMDDQHTTMTASILRQAVKKIRFHAMTPQEFAEGPAISNLLKKSEALTIFINISKSIIKNSQIPEGFCPFGKRDRVDNYDMTFYCITRPLMSSVQSESFIATESNYNLKFSVNENIYMLGVQLKQDLKSRKVLHNDHIYFCYVCLVNNQGTVIRSTSSIRITTEGIHEFLFKYPLFIQRNQNYDIKIKNMGCRYNFLMYSWDCKTVYDDITINILPENPTDSKVANPLFSIIYSSIYN